MLKPYPLASQYALDWIILLKSNQDTTHWYVPKDNCQCQRREQEEYIQLPVLDNIDKRVVQSCIFLICSDSFCFAHRFAPFLILILVKMFYLSSIICAFVKIAIQLCKYKLPYFLHLVNSFFINLPKIFLLFLHLLFYFTIVIVFIHINLGNYYFKYFAFDTFIFLHYNIIKRTKIQNILFP